jgi:hypothetical protein
MIKLVLPWPSSASLNWCILSRRSVIQQSFPWSPPSSSWRCRWRAWRWGCQDDRWSLGWGWQWWGHDESVWVKHLRIWVSVFFFAFGQIFS